MRPAVTVLATVRLVERTALGHLACELVAGSTRYDVLADPQALMRIGQRLYAVLAPLHAGSTAIPKRWHLLWCRPERLPSDGGTQLGSPEATLAKD